MMTESQTRPAFLEVDLTSQQGLALQRAVSDRYGPTIVQAAHLASRIFLLRSPWAPGLRFVGAETIPQPLEGTAGVSFSLSGSGELLEEAFVSCVGEGVDRLAQIERAGDIATIASLSEVAAQLPPEAAGVSVLTAAPRLSFRHGCRLRPARQPARGKVGIKNPVTSGTIPSRTGISPDVLSARGILR
uniref:hypothetical protein n=1 Tax=Bradyrhizobium sp. TaxID=376 RepID=UPI0025C46A55